MKVFKQLRPFIMICQASGLFPFTVKTNKVTSEFEGFSFSWKKPITWWFVLLFIGQFVFASFDTHTALEIFYTEGVQKGLIPPMFAIFMLAEHLFFFILMLASRYVMFKYSHIKRAVEILRRIHTVLSTGNLPPEKFPSIKRPVAAAIFLVFACTFSVIASTSSLLFLIIDRGMKLTALFLTISWVLVMGMLTSSLSFIYLSYCVVTSYIKAVKYDLEFPSYFRLEDDAQGVRSVDAIDILKFPPTLWRDQLRKTKKLVGFLCESLIELNKVFSLPALLFLVTRLVSVSFCLYVIIYGLLNGNSFLVKLLPAVATFFILSLTNILALFVAVDLPINQMKELRETIFSLSNERAFNPAEELECLSLVQSLSEDRVRLSAAGLFRVGMHLLLATITNSFDNNIPHHSPGD